MADKNTAELGFKKQIWDEEIRKRLGAIGGDWV